jgi:hypothetical protein
MDLVHENIPDNGEYPSRAQTAAPYYDDRDSAVFGMMHRSKSAEPPGSHVADTQQGGIQCQFDPREHQEAMGSLTQRVRQIQVGQSHDIREPMVSKPFPFGVCCMTYSC